MCMSHIFISFVLSDCKGRIKISQLGCNFHNEDLFYSKLCLLMTAKILSFGKVQINLAFHSFIRIFATSSREATKKRHNMALNLNKNLKLYYSIKEVAEMFELNESTLRYWEQEFPFLKPKTSGAAKVRQYQEKDIEQVLFRFREL